MALEDLQLGAALYHDDESMLVMYSLRIPPPEHACRRVSGVEILQSNWPDGAGVQTFCCVSGHVPHAIRFLN